MCRFTVLITSERLLTLCTWSLAEYPWPTGLSDAPLHTAHLETQRVTVVGEWGGLGFAAPAEHSWDAAAAEQGWGYAKYRTEEETTAELVKRTGEILVPMAHERVVAAIWTQTTDVEEEINGLLSYDREQKLNLELAGAANRALVATAKSIEMPRGGAARL